MYTRTEAASSTAAAAAATSASAAGPQGGRREVGKSGAGGGGELQAALPFGSCVPSSLASAAAAFRRCRSPPWCCTRPAVHTAHRSNDSRDDTRSQRQGNEKKKRKGCERQRDTSTMILLFFFFSFHFSRRERRADTHTCWRSSGSEERVRSAPIQGHVEKKTPAAASRASARHWLGPRDFPDASSARRSLLCCSNTRT